MCIFSTFKCNPRQVCNSKDTCYILESATLFEKSKKCLIWTVTPKTSQHGCLAIFFPNQLCPSVSSDYIFRYDNCLHIQTRMKNYRLSCTPLMVLLDVGRRRKLEDSMHFEIILSDTISHWLPTTPKAQWRRRNNLEFHTHLREDFSILGLF